MASSVSNYGAVSERSRYSKRKRKIHSHSHQVADHVTKRRTRWRTDSEQQIYSMKLVEALCRTSMNLPSSTTSISVQRGLTFRETADTVLAASAKGRTRWSRAILSRRLSLKHTNKRHPKVKFMQKKKKKEEKAKRRLPLAPFKRKVKVLGHLVPGCRNLSLANILDETADYIAALEMQVRAMNAFAGILSGGAGTLTTDG